MDSLFNASFVDFIKTEKNCDFNGRHIAHLVKDYKLDQVVHGIKWLVEGWSVEGTARLLKNVFEDWLPELAGFAIARIGSDWELRPKMGLIVAFMMMGETEGVAALFIRSLTIGWDASKVTELISCLDSVLEWESSYFTKFAELLLQELHLASLAHETPAIDPSLIIHSLSTMYKTTTALTNHRILMADLRLAVAKSHYLTQFAHSITPASVIAGMRNRVNVRDGFLMGPNGSNRGSTTLESRARTSESGTLNPRDSLSSDEAYATLLSRIPPSLREFFGDSSTSETDFTFPTSAQDFLDQFDNSDMDSETSSTQNPLLATRTNSSTSITSSTPPITRSHPAFSRLSSSLLSTHSQSSFFTRQTSTTETPILPLPTSTIAGMIVPSSVFHPDSTTNVFRTATGSMMSLALSSLDLTSPVVAAGVTGLVEETGAEMDSNLRVLMDEEGRGGVQRVLERGDSFASTKST
ncbi:hypothetical protein HDU98_000012 [Podochytrium sp. JEL0797]|nr:hypothetical protein HDU98_000012 [Podochytrium sp. JEL0797]